MSKGRSKTGWFVFMFIFIVAVIGAIVTNPEETEAKASIKEQSVKIINKKIAGKIDEIDVPGSDKLGKFITDALVPKLYDKMIDVDIKDYVIFSTFTIFLDYKLGQREIASGIILYGQIVPLKYDKEGLRKLKNLAVR